MEFPTAPYLIPDLKPNVSGVDFLNLRQVNLDAMDHCFPGVNNVTLHVRPYSLMCWTHWKIVEEMERRGAEEVLPSQVKRFREKIESLVVWGAQNEMLSGVPGSSSKRPIGEGGMVPLDFKTWKRSESNTSYLAAVQYGPSLGDLSGLGFLHWEGAVPRVTRAGEALAKAFDESIRTHLVYDDLVNPDLMTCDPDFADTAFSLLHPLQATSEEKELFRDRLFHEELVGNLRLPAGRRSTSISLILALLEAGLPAGDASVIRDGMTFVSTPDGDVLSISPEQEAMSHVWAFLQTRQLQRIAMEGLLSWVERQLKSPRKPDELIEAAVEHLATQRNWVGDETVGSIAESCCPVFQAMAEHREQWLADPARFSPARRADALAVLTGNAGGDPAVLLAGCVDALLFVARSVAWMEGSPATKARLTEGGSERISLAFWQATVNRMASKPLRDLLDILLKNLVVSQHFAVGTDRYDGERIRLRLILDEQGLDFLRDAPWRPAVTRDRLGALFGLMGSCGMV